MSFSNTVFLYNVNDVSEQHGIPFLHSESYKSSIVSILYINFENNDQELKIYKR